MSIRRTRSTLNLEALPTAVTSFAELNSALVEVTSSLQAFDIPPHELPAKPDVSKPQVIETTKNLLPKLVKSIERLHKHGDSVTAVLATLTACSTFLSSEECQTEMVQRAITSDALKSAVNEMVVAKIAEMSEAGEIEVPETSVERNTDLEDKVHWTVSKLVDKSFRKKALSFGGSITSWPPYDPAFVDFKTTILVNGTPKEVWRPQWDDFEASKPFVDACEAFFIAHFEEQYPALVVRERVRRYMSWISGELRKLSEGIKAAEKKSRATSSRTLAVTKGLKATFPTSLLNRCQERALYERAIDIGIIKMTQLAHDEHHGLAVRNPGEPESHDAFLLYRDLWFETRGVVGDAWVCKETPWWSEELTRAFWTLYEEANNPAEGKGRTPLFHLPPALRDPLSLDSLPTLAPPPSTTGRRPSKKSRISKTALELTRGMVATSVLLDDEYDAWRVDLRADPVPSEEDQGRLPLKDLLDRPENAELKRAVEKRMTKPELIEENELKVLWQIREMGSAGQYEAALRMRDESGEKAVQSFLKDFDLTSLYVVDD